MNNSETIVRIEREPTLKGVLKGDDNGHSAPQRVIEDFGNLVVDMKTMLDTDVVQTT